MEDTEKDRIIIYDQKYAISLRLNCVIGAIEKDGVIKKLTQKNIEDCEKIGLNHMNLISN